MPPKSGPLSAAEKAFLREHLTRAPVDEVARRANRSRDVVLRFAEREMGLSPAELEGPGSEQALLRRALRKSAAWRQLQDELTPEELVYFEERWVALMAQFREDVLPTEATDVENAIRLEVLQGRNMRARKKDLEGCARADAMMATLLQKHGDDPRKWSEAVQARALLLEGRLAKLRDDERARTIEYAKLEEKHAALMKGLKATRDQRVTRFEDGKTSFLGVIKRLQEEEERQREGAQMMLMREAMLREKGRLGALTEYDDGTRDQPLLSAETVEAAAAAAGEAGADGAVEVSG